MLKSLLPNVYNSKDNFRYEKFLYSKGFLRVAGVDEVGRGPLAGPVVAACVVLPVECEPQLFVDSKLISHKRRLELFNHLSEIGACIGIGSVSEKTIDKINILQASLLAMKRAAENIPAPSPDYLLVDGKFPVPMMLPQEALVKGESRSGSIAAASIAAKVTRDDIMSRLHTKHPLYNFAKNKGYPTQEHRNAVAKFGPTPYHRKTFKGVREHVK